ncbi:LLM class flavin-dependent oxidoreductase [[Mycobacterium] nativiensis]|uniref:LLM class flavin-dependent oxidoreductase n=1 Tax=[Mycobacterium] nativiensis TaxID=2855503 RepID=A0ABU5XZJ2_9MYCO|nr:LLM class flavin-dependent oxidoreductase [Mycolicibacter sp. MYC340]MEB3033298.1 LLM class flavin-dependent oxidoreductase [Mycolicibacter sp. MYC340]
MTRDVDLGVVALLTGDQWKGAEPQELVRLVRTVEDLGFDSLWANDSLFGPRLEALTFLTAAATVTERITLGTAALLPALRRPVQTAQALASLDLVSHGRLIVGVGAGFPGASEREYALSQVPWRRRFDRLDDTVALWRQLWAGEGPGEFHSATISLAGLPDSIAPATPGGPPVWLAGDTPKARTRAGTRYDGWLPYPPTPKQYEAGLDEVLAAAQGTGRAKGAVIPGLFVTVLITDAPDCGREALERFTKATYGYPLRIIEQIQTFATGSAEQVATALAGYIDAGARHLVCRIAALTLGDYHDQLNQLRQVREAIA